MRYQARSKGPWWMRVVLLLLLPSLRSCRLHPTAQRCPGELETQLADAKQTDVVSVTHGQAILRAFKASLGRLAAALPFPTALICRGERQMAGRQAQRNDVEC
jgi:hypothetical protein